MGVVVRLEGRLTVPDGAGRGCLVRARRQQPAQPTQQVRGRVLQRADLATLVFDLMTCGRSSGEPLIRRRDTVLGTHSRYPATVVDWRARYQGLGKVV